MLVESPNNVSDTTKDRIDVDEKEMIIPAAVVETARASGSSPYLDILVTSSKTVAKRDTLKKKNNTSTSSVVSDASLIYAGYTASTTPNVIDCIVQYHSTKLRMSGNFLGYFDRAC